MEFFVYETGENIKARLRPIVMITSNNEKELPDAFLRRCFFHYIKFPDVDTMNRIVDVHFPDIKKRLVEEALRIFFEVREVPGLKKKPSTSELLDWLKLLLNEDITPEMLRGARPAQADPAAARRAPQERAGRASVRAAGVFEPARGVEGSNFKLSMSCPAKAGHPVRRGLSVLPPTSLEYWIARSSRAMTAGNFEQRHCSQTQLRDLAA